MSLIPKLIHFCCAFMRKVIPKPFLLYTSNLLKLQPCIYYTRVLWVSKGSRSSVATLILEASSWPWIELGLLSDHPKAWWLANYLVVCVHVELFFIKTSLWHWYLFSGSFHCSRGVLTDLLRALKLYPVCERALLTTFRHGWPASNSKVVGYKLLCSTPPSYNGFLVRVSIILGQPGRSHCTLTTPTRYFSGRGWNSCICIRTRVLLLIHVYTCTRVREFTATATEILNA